MNRSDFLRLKDIMASLQDEKSIRVFLDDMQVCVETEMNDGFLQGYLILRSPSTGISVIKIGFDATQSKEPPELAWDQLCAGLMKEGINFLHTKLWQTETERLKSQN